MIEDFIHQTINIEDSVLEEIRHHAKRRMEWLSENASKIDFFNKVPVITEIENLLGLSLLFNGLIYVNPGTKPVIHSDIMHTDNTNSIKCRLALNIPLENCEGVTTNFYKELKHSIPRDRPNGARYNYFRNEDVEKIASIEITSPTLIRIDIPHSVHNPTDKTRKALTIRFKEDPWHWVKK